MLYSLPAFTRIFRSGPPPPARMGEFLFTDCGQVLMKYVYSQYCKVDKNQTVGFIDCAVRVAQAGNYSTGVVGCWENDATRSRMGVWGSVAVGLGAAVVGLVSFV